MKRGVASTDAKVVEGDQPTVLISLTEEGRTKFSKLTGESVGKPIAIVANGRLISAPVVQQKIEGDSIQISGNLTKEEAAALVELFHKGKEGR